MYFVDRTAVVLKPTARFLEWLKSADENMPDLTIEQIRANCSVFLVPQFDEPEAVIAYLTNATNRFSRQNSQAGTSIKASGRKT